MGFGFWVNGLMLAIAIMFMLLKVENYLLIEKVILTFRTSRHGIKNSILCYPYHVPLGHVLLNIAKTFCYSESPIGRRGIFVIN
jgi:hypothetical protein